jgi:hypothetical protein
MAGIDRQIRHGLCSTRNGREHTFRPSVFPNMRLRFQKCAALILAAILHMPVLLLAWTTPEVGRNIPTLKYPVRERVMHTHIVTISPAPAQVTTKSLPLARQKPSPTPPASSAEGKLESDEKVYMEYSTRYFTPKDLDDPPHITSPPDLGVENIGPTIEGEAVLSFYINEHGTVDKIEIEHNTLPEIMMEKMRLGQAELRFIPGRKNGLTVKSVMRYHLVLERDPGIAATHIIDDFSQ